MSPVYDRLPVAKNQELHTKSQIKPLKI